MPPWPGWRDRSSQRGAGQELTLGQNQGIGLDKVVEGLLGQLVNIGVVGRCQGGKGGQKAKGDTLVLHNVCDVWTVRARATLDEPA